MKIGKILIIPLIFFVLMFGASKLEVHAEEVTEYKYTYQFYMKYPLFENDFDGPMNQFENCIVQSNWKLVAYYDEEYPGRPNEYHLRIVAVNTDGIYDDFKYKVEGEVITYEPEGNIVKFGDARQYFHVQVVTADNFMSVADGLDNHLVGLEFDMNIPLFDSKESANNYIVNNDTSGQLNRPDIDIDNDGILNSSFEIPNLSVDSIGYDFGFNNGSENTYFEMKGRWYSVDDIELFKENLMWKYKYSSFIKSDLTTWVSANDRLLSTERFNFAQLGHDAFENFIQTYPVDNRTYTGGSNVIGNWLGGYNDALSQIKLLLNEPTSIYNGVEVYVRYFYFDSNGVPVYSKWTHYYDNLADAAGSSGSTWDDKENMFTENQSQNGLTSEELGFLEESNNSRNDPDAVPKYNNNTNYFDRSEGLVNATNDFFSMLQGLFAGMGQFPSMVSQIFGYLPSWLISLLALSLAAIVIMRFIGR